MRSTYLTEQIDGWLKDAVAEGNVTTARSAPR